MSKTDPSPPSYESTIYSDNNISSQPQTETQRIQTRLTTIRTQHVNDIITTHILPVIDRRASSGLNRTSIALIPLLDSSTESTDTTPPSKVIDVVSGGSDDDDDGLEKVQLTDSVATLGFWSQDAVIEQLRIQLLQRLRSSDGSSRWRGGIKGDELSTLKVSSQSQQQQQSSSPKSRSRGFFSRRVSSRQGKEGSGNPSTGVMNSGLASHEPATVDVRLDELCLRTMSTFGLYETMTRPALIVRVVIHA